MPPVTVVDSFECPSSVLNFEGKVSHDLIVFLIHKELFERHQITSVDKLEFNIHFRFGFVFVSYRCTSGVQQQRRRTGHKFRLRKDKEQKLPVRTDWSLTTEPIVSLITIKKDYLTEEDYAPTTPTPEGEHVW